MSRNIKYKEKMKSTIFNIEKTKYVIRLSVKEKYRFENFPCMLDFSKIQDQTKFFEKIKEFASKYSIKFFPDYRRNDHCIIANLYIGINKGDESYGVSIININSNFFDTLYANDINLDLTPFKAYNDIYIRIYHLKCV